jgi:ketosteroid isomerase-like protein
MKNTCLSFILVLLAACKSNAPQSQPFDLQQVKQIISNNNKLYRIALLSGDSAAFADLHHSATLNMPPGALTMKGQGPMGAMIEQMPANGVTDYKLTTTNVYGGPEDVIEEGKYELDTGNNKLMEKGKYIVIWKLDKDRWKIYRSIWNTDPNK